MPESTQPLDENIHSKPERNIPVAPELYPQLQQTASWAQILAITNFSSAGLQLLSMFILLERVRMLMRFYAGGSNYALAIIILSLIFICFTALIGWHLWNYSARLKAAISMEDSEELELAYYYQYRYFKTLGWMVISSLILVVGAIILFIYVDTLGAR
jgi:hypothetical protein